MFFLNRFVIQKNLYNIAPDWIISRSVHSPEDLRNTQSVLLKPNK